MSQVPEVFETVYGEDEPLGIPTDAQLEREFQRHPEAHWDVVRERVIDQPLYVPFTEAQWTAIKSS